jgi:hypothetical protein
MAENTASPLSSRLMRLREEAARRPAMTTPRRLRALSILIAASAIALTLVGTGTMITAEVTVVGVQQRTVPAILGMQRIHAWLAEADRSAANAYLAGGSEVTLPELQYQADIAAASRELQSASEHNPAGSDASLKIQAVATMIDQYVGLVNTANVDDRLGRPEGTVYLTAGTGMMHAPATGILARVDELRALYANQLDQANRTLRVTEWMATAYIALGLGLLVLLWYTQGFMRRRFRRRWNMRLMAATALLLFVGVVTFGGAYRADNSVRTAENQTYTRLLHLWNARALLYDANGNESLWLIQREQPARTGADLADAAFQAETRQLVDRPLTDGLLQDAQRGQVRFGGMLADELNASTTDEERAAAMRVLGLYRKFMDADAQVRSRATSGKPTDAVTLALGTDQGQLVFAFADVDWYLGLVIQRLQGQFDSTITTAEQVIGGMAAVELLPALLIVALTFWAVQPRIREFRAGGPRRSDADQRGVLWERRPSVSSG